MNKIYLFPFFIDNSLANRDNSPLSELRCNAVNAYNSYSRQRSLQSNNVRLSRSIFNPMPASFTKKQTWFLVVLGLATAIIIGASFYLINQLIAAEWWVEHTLEVEKEAKSALVCLMDCETAYRGYLITAEADYLQPYETCWRHVASHVEALQKLTADNPRQKVPVERLFTLANDKIKFSQQVIAARKNNPSAPARGLVSLEPGKKIMDEFRYTIAGVLDAEEHLLDVRTRAANRVKTNIYLVISMLAAVVLATLFWIARMSRLFVSEQERERNLTNKARNEAIEANKLKSQFIATMSHEIRTPLSGVIGLAEVMTQQPDLPPKTKEIADQIFGSSKQLLSILNELLDYSKLESGKTTLESAEFPVLRLINQVVDLTKTGADEKGLRLSVAVAPDVPGTIKGDETKVRQVLLNLVHNAIKFTEQGGVEIGVECVADKKQIRFAVVDTGMGIAPELQKHLFIPFVQADAGIQRKYGGSGLGLSIAKRYVEMMSGSIELKSSPGEGTAVWFTVPIELVVPGNES